MKHRQSLYSIEFGPSLDTIRSRTDTILDYGDDQMHERVGGLEGENGELSLKPMTPRRVKRRSVMHRGSNSRQSTTSRRSSSHNSHKNTLRSEGGSSGTNSRNSTRNSRRKHHQNPVTKLLEQQQQSTMHIHGHHPKQSVKHQFGSFHHKESSPALTISNLQSLSQEIHNNMNAVTSSGAGGSLTKTNNNHYQSFRKNIPPDPIYYNTNAHTAYLQQQQWQEMQQSPSPITTEEPQSPTLTLTPSLGGGHFNPSYQHSTTNLNDAEQVDELYNNRPPSVRSSYSNFHGARSTTSYLPSTNITENVFASLVATNTAQNSNSSVKNPAPSGATVTTYTQHQQQYQQIQRESPSTPPLYQQHPLHQHSLSQQSLPPPLPDPPYVSSQPQPIPFHKRTASRESIRSMAFLNSGPPAYNLNYHTPPDSETTM